jgi:hypothetical protein
MQKRIKDSPAMDLYPASAWLDLAEAEIRFLLNAQDKLLHYSQAALEISSRHRREAADLASAMIGELQQVGPSPAAISVCIRGLKDAIQHTLEEVNEQMRAGCTAVQELSESSSSVITKLAVATAARNRPPDLDASPRQRDG